MIFVWYNQDNKEPDHEPFDISTKINNKLTLQATNTFVSNVSAEVNNKVIDKQNIIVSMV